MKLSWVSSQRDLQFWMKPESQWLTGKQSLPPTESCSESKLHSEAQLDLSSRTLALLSILTLVMHMSSSCLTSNLPLFGMDQELMKTKRGLLSSSLIFSLDHLQLKLAMRDKSQRHSGSLSEEKESTLMSRTVTWFHQLISSQDYSVFQTPVDSCGCKKSHNSNKKILSTRIASFLMLSPKFLFGLELCLPSKKEQEP